MSLINQVLQDLDRRRATPAGLPTTAPGVPLRALPTPGAGWRRRSLAAFVATAVTAALAIGAAFAWHSAHGGGGEQPAAAMLPAGRPTAGAAPATAPRADVAKVAALAPAPTPAPGAIEATTPVPVATTYEALGPELHRATTARLAPEPLARPAASIAAAVSRVALASPTAATPALAPPATVTTMLDKRARPTTARDRAESEYQRGLELHRQGQDKDAEAAFMKALDEDRGHAPARQALAVAWIGQGRSDDARQLLATGLALSPQQTALAMLLARIELDRNDAVAAIAVLRKSLDNTPNASAGVAAGRALLATLQQRQGQHGEATLNFGAALRQEPRHGAWWIGLATSLAAEGKTNSAREAFERARASDDLDPELARYVEQSLRASAR